MDTASLEDRIDIICKYISGSLYEPEVEGFAHSVCASGSIVDISAEYESIMSQETRKKTGRFYTHSSIIKYMLSDVLGSIDIAANPFIRILDPACGCGYFLLEAYDILRQRFEQEIDDINSKNPGIDISPHDIHGHIIRYNLFGADTDEMAVKLAAAGLMLKDQGSAAVPNIICCDSLVSFQNTLFSEDNFLSYGFDIIIGNPPYIGHKKTDGKYRRLLNKIYGDVFRDKADISFCFIKSSIDRLKDGGRLCFITSRYFMESPSGRAVRNYIKSSCIIERIVDFYGVRIMKGISVDPVIVFLKKGSYEGNGFIGVYKAEDSIRKLDINNVFNGLKSENSRYFRCFSCSQKELDDSGWVLCEENEMSIIRKVEKGLCHRLSDVCESFQGIITGCDDAFIMDDETAEQFNIEKSILRPWIKGKCINKYTIDSPALNIIYSDFIDKPEDYRHSISYIEKHRHRLEGRRECIKGIRKWYQLQWGRDSKLFDMKKIVFPYKSPCSRFALDSGSYSSADVYGMYIRDRYKDSISYEFLLGILNSRLYEFYFKSFGKKLGDNLYDYYPNTVMRLMVPSADDEYISARVKELLNTSEKDTVQDIIKDIDCHVYEMFNISDDEMKKIERRLGKL